MQMERIGKQRYTAWGKRRGEIEGGERRKRKGRGRDRRKNKEIHTVAYLGSRCGFRRGRAVSSPPPSQQKKKREREKEKKGKGKIREKGKTMKKNEKGKKEAGAERALHPIPQPRQKEGGGGGEMMKKKKYGCQNGLASQAVASLPPAIKRERARAGRKVE